MPELQIRTHTTKSGLVYQYRFEIASIGGKRKWVTKSGFKTRKEAVEAGKIAQESYERVGIPLRPSDMSFSDLLTLWMKKDVSISCKQTTVAGYEKKISSYIKPALGVYRMRTIAKQDIIDFRNDMYDRGFSYNTIISCMGIINECFNYAVDNCMLRVSPASKIKPLRRGGRPPKTPTRQKPHVYITEDEMKRIFERFPEGTPNHLALQLGYRCGLRIAEVFALTWDDIDLDAKTIEVNRQVQWQNDKDRTDIKEKNGTSEAGNGYWYFAEPKYGSYRVITIDDELAELLKREKNRQEKAGMYFEESYHHYYSKYPLYTGGKGPSALQVVSQISTIPTPYEIKFVNVRTNGEYITFRTMQHTSKVIHEKLQMPQWDFHSLRHTHATMLSEQGVPLVYIQKRLGHKSLDVTAEVYTSHLTETLQSQGNQILNNMFKKA